MKHIKTFEGHKHGTLHTEKFDENVHIPMYQKLANKYGFIEKEPPEDFSYGDDKIEKIYGYWEKSMDQYFTVFKPEFSDVQISYSDHNKSGYEDAVTFLVGNDNFDDSISKKFFESMIYEAFGSKLTQYGYKVKQDLLDILCDVKRISEKDFKRIDDVQEMIDLVFEYNPEIDEIIKRYDQQNKRVSYCAEHIYDWFIKETEYEKI